MQEQKQSTIVSSAPTNRALPLLTSPNPYTHSNHRSSVLHLLFPAPNPPYEQQLASVTTNTSCTSHPARPLATRAFWIATGSSAATRAPALVLLQHLPVFFLYIPGHCMNREQMEPSNTPSCATSSLRRGSLLCLTPKSAVATVGSRQCRRRPYDWL
jgi:hypothetical protein